MTKFCKPMKTFTARDLNINRNEIKEAIKGGGCILQFKHADRSLELEAVIIEKALLDRLERSQ